MSLFVGGTYLVVGRHVLISHLDHARQFIVRQQNIIGVFYGQRSRAWRFSLTRQCVPNNAPRNLTTMVEVRVAVAVPLSTNETKVSPVVGASLT